MSVDYDEAPLHNGSERLERGENREEAMAKVVKIPTTGTHAGVANPFELGLLAAMDSNRTDLCVCSDLQTEDYSPLYAWYNYILIILALPSLSVFGVCTNIVNVFIYSRKRLQNSANTYLLFLACSDFLVILTGLFIFWIDSARSYIPELARAPYTTVYTLPFGYMAQTCSIYFTVAAAFDCYINVCWLRFSRSYCTVRRAQEICGSIAVCSIIYNSLRFPQFNLSKCFHEASQETIIEICPTKIFFVINEIYNVYMYMVLMTLLPFLVLLILNAIIVVRQSLNSKEWNNNTTGCVEGSLASVDEDSKKKSETPGGDDTITMIMVVVLFLACNTLALIVNVIETFFDPDPLLLNLLSDASNFLVVFNSSVNCVIYLIFNNEYRDVFLIHARRILGLIRRGYCCSPLSRRRRSGSQGVTYQPVSHLPLHSRISRPSIQSPAHTHSLLEGDEGRQSPVWQPLTSRHLAEFSWPGRLSRVNGTSPAPSFDPHSQMLLMDDEEELDSGWGDSASMQVLLEAESKLQQASSSKMGTTTRWLAEVKLVEGDDSACARPHILVKPLSYRGDSISITAL